MNIRMKRLAQAGIALAFPMVIACKAAAVSQSSDETLAVLHGVQYLEDKLVIEVTSNGCTLPEHFSLEVLHSKTTPINVSVHRLKSDKCRRLPMAKQIELALPAKLNGNAIKVVNPLRPSP